MIVKTGFHMERGRGGNEKELKKTVQIAIYHVIWWRTEEDAASP